MKLSDKNQIPSFISPTKILREVGLRPGMTVVDYASGAGHWSLAAARKVAPNGRVLAIENDINKLNLLKSRAELAGVLNIGIEELELENNSSHQAKDADLVIVSNILHLIKDKQAFVKRAEKMLKLDGKLLVVDWLQKKTLFGPPAELRLDEEGVISLVEHAGLTLVSSVEAATDHFGLIFIKKGKHES